MATVVWLLFGAVGCIKVGPDFVQPSAPTTEHWIEEEDPRIKRQEADYTAWWQVFDDPILNRLVETAYRQNLDLLTAGLRVLEARAQLGIAIGDQYPQTQEAQGSFARERLSKNAPNTAGADRNFDNLSVGLDASWEIDFWGRFQRGIESADSGLGASIADYDDLLVILTAEVATTYTQVREFEQRIRLTRRNVELQMNQRIVDPRIDQHRVALSRRHNGIVPLSGDIHRFAGSTGENPEIVVLRPVAGTTSVEVVLPGEDPFGVEGLGPDMLDFIGHRVFAVATSPNSAAHLEELGTDHLERLVSAFVPA